MTLTQHFKQHNCGCTPSTFCMKKPGFHLHLEYVWLIFTSRSKSRKGLSVICLSVDPEGLDWSSEQDSWTRAKSSDTCSLSRIITRHSHKSRHQKQSRQEQEVKDKGHWEAQPTNVFFTNKNTCLGTWLLSDMDKLVRKPSAVVGTELDSQTSVAEQQKMDRLLSILDNRNHPLHSAISRQTSRFGCQCPAPRTEEIVPPPCLRLFNTSRGEQYTR